MAATPPVAIPFPYTIEDVQITSCPLYVHPNENPSVILVSPPLSEKNFHSWSRSMKMSLLTKNKLGFVDGTIPDPGEAHALYPYWQRCNTMVLGWLIRSMNPEIAQSILWREKAIEVWSELKERFSQADLFRISELQEEIYNLKQGDLSFVNIGHHGTKIIIFNLWCNHDGDLELDFDTDPEDIHIAGHFKKTDTTSARKKIVNEQHIANRFKYSLRVYLSILYLRIPEHFRIILRGQVVKLHNIADDLKHIQYILYTPQSGGSKKATFVTTIGFLKEAPEVNIHGFNIYHKNRLILPFWPAVSYGKNRGRGVVGVLQADYIEPTHNKQDFERSSLSQKLEIRLKEMALEYWDYHCHLIGYPEVKHKAPVSQCFSSMQEPLAIVISNASNNCSNSQSRYEQAPLAKRKTRGFIDPHKAKRQSAELNVIGVSCSQNVQTMASPADQVVDQEAINLIEAKKNLIAECLEHEKTEEELNLKVAQLRSKIEEAQHEYNRLLAEAQPLKEE